MSDRLASSFDDLSVTDTSADLDTCLALLASSDQPGAQDVVDELISLSAIYQSEDGQPTLTAYHPPLHTSHSSSPPSYSPGSTLLVLLRTTLPSPHDHIPLSLILSLPPTYPESSAPLLQLENRFLGPEAVPAPLWASVLRTFLHEPMLAPPPSGEEAVEWVPGSCCLYEGIEKVREVCGKWIGEKEVEREKGEKRREEVAKGSLVGSIPTQVRAETQREESVRESRREEAQVLVDCPPITTTEALVDRKSVFVGHAARVTSIEEINAVKSALLSNPKISRASHPCMLAYRFTTPDGILHADNDDDGEDAAGSRLAQLLVLLGLQDVLVVVTRWYGGIHLSSDRFKDINYVARAALEQGGFLDELLEDGKKGGAKGGKGGNANKAKKR